MCGEWVPEPGRGRAESLYRLLCFLPAPWQDVGVPLSAPVHLSRRRFVATAAGLAGFTVAGGCAVPSPDREPDPLISLAENAARDAREFAVANESHGSSAGALRRLADVRQVHAERLTDEVERAANGDLFGSAESDGAGGAPRVGSGESTVPVSESSANAAAVCPPVDQVRTRLHADAQSAAEVAVSAVGYRAELAAAVSASCTAALEVELA